MRFLAVLSAIFLVGAFALAWIFAPDVPLRLLLASADTQWPVQFQHQLEVWSPWIWQNLAIPLLDRPAWLVPASLGLICAGGAYTLACRDPSPKRRRS